MALKIVIAFVLLAMAATITHARLDLLRMPSSKSQQPINHGGGAEKSGFIPYPECIEKCDECPVCTLNLPIEKSLCLCVNHTHHAHHVENKKRMPSAIESPGKTFKFLHHMAGTEMTTKSELVASSDSEWLPYPECIKQCDSCPICTLPYPPERALCLCVNKPANHKQPQPLPASKIQTLEKEEEMKVDSRGKSDLMGSGKRAEVSTKSELVASSDSEWLPYPECIKQCDSCPICTLPYPPEFAVCLCVKNNAIHKQPQLLPASKIQTLGVVEKEEEMKVDSRGKSDIMGSGDMTWAGGIPYPICIKICKECACTRIYPIELATCICLDKDLSKSRLEMK